MPSEIHSLELPLTPLYEIGGEVYFFHRGRIKYAKIAERYADLDGDGGFVYRVQFHPDKPVMGQQWLEKELFPTLDAFIQEVQEQAAWITKP